MNYKRILFPFKESCEKIPLEKSLQDFQNQFGFILPESQIKMLSECNGGSFQQAHIKYTTRENKIGYAYVDCLYGFGYDYRDLKLANQQHKDEYIDNCFSEFTFDLASYIRLHDSEEKLKTDGIIPEYFDYNDNNQNIYEFYNDFSKYINKLDIFIEGLDPEESDVNKSLIYMYKEAKFFCRAVEFSIDDGHGRYYLYYEEETKEPSVYCGVDLQDFYKVADSFDDFLKNLTVVRTEICFGIKNINESVCDFINSLSKEFVSQALVSSEELKEKISNCVYDVKISSNDDISISIMKCIEAVYRDFNYNLNISSSNRFYYYVDDEINPYDEFIQKYEKQIIDIYNLAKNSDIVLLYTIGVNNLYDEVMKVYG